MTNAGPLDERYLEWLYSHIGTLGNRNPARSHWLLAEELYRIEFTQFVPNDDNRIADAMQLREEFIINTGAERDPSWMELGCSVFEMLVALCKRVEFESAHDSYYWFWRIITNLNLDPYSDEQFDEQVRLIVQDTFAMVINRTYRRDGTGGLFPLRRPILDQRRVEIWYQMSAYLLENGYE